MAEVIKETKNPLYIIKDNNVNQIGKTTIDFLNKYKLQKGTTVTFRLLTKKPNSDPKTRTAKPFIYPNISLRTQFWIDDKENGPVEIAAVQSVNRDNTFRIKKYAVDGVESDGLFILYGDVVEDQKIFPYLMLSPQNKTSLFAKEDEAIFEVVDAKSDAKKSINRVGMLQKCLTFNSSLEHEELVLYNTAFGGNVNDDVEIMLDRLNMLAMKDPADYYKKVDAPTLKATATIKQATDLNFIQYDAQTHSYSWVGGDKIASLDRIDNKQPIELFSEWLITSPTGDKVQKMIVAKMKK